MSFEKFRILLWKNWIIQKRHFKGLTFEIIFPTLLIILFTWVKILYGRDDESYLQVFQGNIESPNSCLNRTFGSPKIAFSPSSPWIEDILIKVFDGSEILEVEGFENSNALDIFLRESATENFVVGIEFEDLLLVSAEIVFHRGHFTKL